MENMSFESDKCEPINEKISMSSLLTNSVCLDVFDASNDQLQKTYN